MMVVLARGGMMRGGMVRGVIQDLRCDFPSTAA